MIVFNMDVTIAHNLGWRKTQGLQVIRAVDATSGPSCANHKRCHFPISTYWSPWTHFWRKAAWRERPNDYG